MRIVFKAERAVRPRVSRWRVSLGNTRAEQRQRSQFLMAQFQATVVAGGGSPTGAFFDQSTDPPTYWCDLSPGWFVRIHVGPAVRSWRSAWLVATRTVTVVDVASSPGPGR